MEVQRIFPERAYFGKIKSMGREWDTYSETMSKFGDMRNKTVFLKKKKVIFYFPLSLKRLKVCNGIHLRLTALITIKM